MVPRIKRFVLVGVFDSGMFDYDTQLAVHEPGRTRSASST
jgi:hypothetical protein